MPVFFVSLKSWTAPAVEPLGERDVRRVVGAELELFGQGDRVGSKLGVRHEEERQGRKLAEESERRAKLEAAETHLRREPVGRLGRDEGGRCELGLTHQRGGAR